jgi:hypothetical protein
MCPFTAVAKDTASGSFLEDLFAASVANPALQMKTQTMGFAVYKS